MNGHKTYYFKLYHSLPAFLKLELLNFITLSKQNFLDSRSGLSHCFKGWLPHSHHFVQGLRR